jgi:hypothetical protein
MKGQFLLLLNRYNGLVVDASFDWKPVEKGVGV